MAKLKSAEKEKSAAERDQVAMYDVPVKCSRDGCSSRGALGFVGEGPYTFGMFGSEGWVAIPDVQEGAVIFLCRSCYDLAQSEASLDLRPDDEAPEDGEAPP